MLYHAFATLISSENISREDPMLRLAHFSVFLIVRVRIFTAFPHWRDHRWSSWTETFEYQTNKIIYHHGWKYWWQTPKNNCHCSSCSCRCWIILYSTCVISHFSRISWITSIYNNVLYVVQHFCATQFVYCPFPYCAACWVERQPGVTAQWFTTMILYYNYLLSHM